MAFLSINGYDLPPCKRGVSIEVVTLVDQARDANGTVVGQKIGRDQYKIDGLEWSYLTAAQWEGILYAMRNFFFNVTFNDPVSGSKRTVKMYCGNRTGKPYWVDRYGNVTHYTNCKVNLIDTGE